MPPRVPGRPFAVAKKPLGELVLSVSVSTGVFGFVVALLYWSSSCSPSLMLVVADTPAVFGVGVTTTWVGRPR